MELGSILEKRAWSSKRHETWKHMEESMLKVVAPHSSDHCAWVGRRLCSAIK